MKLFKARIRIDEDNYETWYIQTSCRANAIAKLKRDLNKYIWYEVDEVEYDNFIPHIEIR